MKKTVFAFLSLSNAVSTMGYTADHSSPQESVAAAAHTPEAVQQLVVGASQPALPGITAPINTLSTAAVRPRKETERLLRRPASESNKEEPKALNIFSDTEGLSSLLDADHADDEEGRIEPLPCYLQHAADRSDAEAMHSYAVAMYDNAIMVYRGRGSERDLTEVRNYFHKAADLGHRGAMHNYAVMLYNGNGGPQDLIKSRNYYRRAADLGHRGAMHNYAVMLYDGNGGPQDLIKSRNYYRWAADLGVAEAMHNYAKMLYHGKGGEQDLAKARRYYHQAADLGDLAAMNNYAEMLYHGRGGKQNLAKARRYYKQAADLGDLAAMRVLAREQGANTGSSATANSK